MPVRGLFLISRMPRASPSRHPQHRRPGRRVKAPLSSGVPLVIRVFEVSLTRSLGSPPLTRRPQVGAATGMPWGRNAAGRYVTSNNKNNAMNTITAEDVRFVELAKRPVLPLIEDTAQAVEQLQDIKAERKEHFVGLYLNARHELLHKEILSIGTVNASMVHPRDVFAPAILHNASAVIVAHNHPERRRDALAGGQGRDAPTKGGRTTARDNGA